MGRTRLLAAAAVVAVLAALAVGYAVTAQPGGGERRTVPAPIERVDVLTLESSPPQYLVHIRAGLPSGCAERHSHSVTRRGELIEIAVLNSLPVGNPVCTMIYGTYELNVPLGSDFRPGTTYAVHVNDRSAAFRAQ